MRFTKKLLLSAALAFAPFMGEARAHDPGFFPQHGRGPNVVVQLIPACHNHWPQYQPPYYLPFGGFDATPQASSYGPGPGSFPAYPGYGNPGYTWPGGGGGLPMAPGHPNPNVNYGCQNPRW